MKIRAAWSRTVQVRPYESEKLELAIEDDSTEKVTKEQGLKVVEAMSRDLSALGDRLIVDMLKAHRIEDFASRILPIAPSAGVPTPGGMEPDPFV